MKNEQINNSNNANSKKAAISERDLAAEYLANERTFLAWVRTGIAVITLGFALAKVRIWIGEIGLHHTPEYSERGASESIPLGIGMLLFGGLIVVLATWRYFIVNRQIEQGEVKADCWMIVLITIMVVLLVIVMTTYLLFSTAQM